MKSIALVLIPALSLAIVVSAQEAVDPGSRQAGPYRISSFVDLVALELTVLDHHGQFVPGLTESSFRVFEDGVPQQIKFFHHEDVPVTIGLVIDSSGSMVPKRSNVIGAALAFAQASNPNDELFVARFNDDVMFDLPPGKDFTSNAGELQNALLRMQCEGRTALYDAVTEALEHIRKGKYPRKALLVVSDGQDNHSVEMFPDVLAAARKAGAAIYSIAVYDPASDRHNTKVLKQLSGITGGRFYFPDSLGDVVSTCRKIARDIRERYTLAYSPSNIERDGSYRRITVRANSPAGGVLKVMVREGYFAPNAN